MKVTFIKFFENKKKAINRNIQKDSKSSPLKTIVKKNQIALFAIALMLITSGYLNYTNNLKVQVASLGDATLVSTNAVENEIVQAEATEEILQITKLAEAVSSEYNETNEEQVKVAENNKEDYFAKIKLDRDTMYSQMIETYQKILEDNNIQDEQKNVASEEIKNINNRKNAILTIENLIKAKGIDDVSVLINDQIIDVIVKKKDNLTDEEVAQISNIVSRELKADIENIHITFHE